jgi:hypothetical protein
VGAWWTEVQCISYDERFMTPYVAGVQTRGVNAVEWMAEDPDLISAATNVTTTAAGVQSTIRSLQDLVKAIRQEALTVCDRGQETAKIDALVVTIDERVEQLRIARAHLDEERASHNRRACPNGLPPLLWSIDSFAERNLRPRRVRGRSGGQGRRAEREGAPRHFGTVG